MFLHIGIFVFCVLFAASSNSDIYKWLDASGRVHYGDNLPTQRLSKETASEISDTLPILTPMAKPDLRLLLLRPRAETSAADFKKRQVNSKRLSKNKKQCKSYKQRLNKLYKKLRSGYGEPQGNKLRSQRRELAGKIRLHCD